MKNLADIAVFLEDVLGRDAAQVFDDNLEEFVYYVRSEALSLYAVSSRIMKTRLRRLAENIIAAAVKKYLTDNYSDATGDVELNVNEAGIYDKHMQPITALERIRKTQKEMTTLMVQRGMYEFAKGRHLAKIMESRNDDQKGPNPKEVTWEKKQLPTPVKPLLELIEIQILNLESKLPDLTAEQGRTLARLYKEIRASKRRQE